jgi:hypothetical protein
MTYILTFTGGCLFGFLLAAIMSAGSDRNRDDEEFLRQMREEKDEEQE